jgi:hypothetical protein
MAREAFFCDDQWGESHGTLVIDSLSEVVNGNLSVFKELRDFVHS